MYNVFYVLVCLHFYYGYLKKGTENPRTKISITIKIGLVFLEKKYKNSTENKINSKYGEK